MKTPLSWLQLSHEKSRLLIALAGIGFADILMFIQLGFQAALFCFGEHKVIIKQLTLSRTSSRICT